MIDGTRVFLTRQRLRWSQYQIGKYLGISRHVVLKLEQGLDVEPKREQQVTERLERLYKAAQTDLQAIPQPARYFRNVKDVRDAVDSILEVVV